MLHGFPNEQKNEAIVILYICNIINCTNYTAMILSKLKHTNKIY